MTHPILPNAAPATPAPHIPGLITATGVMPAAIPGAPVAAAQPGTVVPDPTAVAYAPPANAAPVPVTAAVQPVGALPPAAPEVLAATPVPVYAPPTLPTTLAPAPVAAVPGLTPAAVPGLQPPAAPAPAAPAAAPVTETPPSERGYPEGTPLEQMTAVEQTAYWKYHARKHEERANARADYDAVKAKAEQYDRQVAANATEAEKAIAAARAAGYQEATARAATVLVDAHVRAGLQTRMSPDQVEVLAANLHHPHFLAADGLSVDAAKVATFVNTVAPVAPAAPAVTAPAVPAAPGALPTGLQPAVPAQPVTGLPRQLPDLGQGAQTAAPLDKLEAGRQAARAFLAGNR